MATLEMARCGPVTGAWDTARFNMAVSTRQHADGGFQKAECSSDIQSSNKIGFWCDYDQGDGSVMMIGGGGKSCSRADHGIGITEQDAASFVEKSSGETEYDFGNDANGQTQNSRSY